MSEIGGGGGQAMVIGVGMSVLMVLLAAWIARARLRRRRALAHDWFDSIHGSREARLAAGAARRLGYDALSLLDGTSRQALLTVGDWRSLAPSNALVATDAVFGADPADVVVTTWTSADGRRLHSVSTINPANGRVVLGWSEDEPSDEQIEGLASLTGLTSRLFQPCAVIDLREDDAAGSGGSGRQEAGQLGEAFARIGSQGRTRDGIE